MVSQTGDLNSFLKGSLWDQREFDLWSIHTLTELIYIKYDLYVYTHVFIYVTIVGVFDVFHMGLIKFTSIIYNVNEGMIFLVSIHGSD